MNELIGWYRHTYVTKRLYHPHTNIFNFPGNPLPNSASDWRLPTRTVPWAWTTRSSTLKRSTSPASRTSCCHPRGSNPGPGTRSQKVTRPWSSTPSSWGSCSTPTVTGIVVAIACNSLSMCSYTYGYLNSLFSTSNTQKWLLSKNNRTAMLYQQCTHYINFYAHVATDFGHFYMVNIVLILPLIL